MEIPKLYSPRELSRISGWSESRIRRLLTAGLLKHIRTDGNYYIPDDALNDYIKRNMFEPCQDITKAQSLSEKHDGIVNLERSKNPNTTMSATRMQKQENLCTSQQARITLKRLRNT